MGFTILLKTTSFIELSMFKMYAKKENYEKKKKNVQAIVLNSLQRRNVFLQRQRFDHEVRSKSKMWSHIPYTQVVWCV